MNNLELEKHLEELSESNPFLEIKGSETKEKAKVSIDHRPTTSGGNGISASFLDTLLGEKPVTLIEHVLTAWTGNPVPYPTSDRATAYDGFDRRRGIST